MAAASNYSSNQDLKNSTFSFANVVPQHGYNNGGIWNTF
jgi:DNA/RNA endonuclease G (NUC1)